MAAVCMGPGPVSLHSLCTTPPPASTPGLHPESALGPSESPGTQDVDNVLKTPGLSSMAHTTETPTQHALDTQTPKPPPKNRDRVNEDGGAQAGGRCVSWKSQDGLGP